MLIQVLSDDYEFGPKWITLRADAIKLVAGPCME